ncbi:MAG: hypothetical protein K0R24_181 [Gammaproteobacteria bacterium]|jgi:hypothetical protein|nr:hypothetical protein [Gammaproteobacteria bacterium]
MNDFANKDEITNDPEKKATRYLLSEEAYALLRDIQQQVFVATETTPSIRKLINLLVTHDNLAKVTEKLIINLNG